MNPGRRVASPRSIVRAPPGVFTLDAEPTHVMLSPTTTIAALLISAAPVPSMRCAARSTKVPGAARLESCAARGAEPRNASASSAKDERPIIRSLRGGSGATLPQRGGKCEPRARAHDDHLHDVARLVRADRVGVAVDVLHRLSAEFDDDVAGLHARLVCGAPRRDARELHADDGRA